MKNSIMATAIAFFAVVSFQGTAKAADIGRPWCHSDNTGASSCDFDTKAQCDASANWGYCSPNPRYWSSTEEAYGSPSAAPSSVFARKPRPVPLRSHH